MKRLFKTAAAAVMMMGLFAAPALADDHHGRGDWHHDNGWHGRPAAHVVYRDRYYRPPVRVVRYVAPPPVVYYPEPVYYYEPYPVYPSGSYTSLSLRF